MGMTGTVAGSDASCQKRRVQEGKEETRQVTEDCGIIEKAGVRTMPEID
jgi:hypothetical protein